MGTHLFVAGTALCLHAIIVWRIVRMLLTDCEGLLFVGSVQNILNNFYLCSCKKPRYAPSVVDRSYTLSAGEIMPVLRLRMLPRESSLDGNRQVENVAMFLPKQICRYALAKLPSTEPTVASSSTVYFSRIFFLKQGRAKC